MRDIKPGGTKGHTERFGQENSHDDEHDHFLGRAAECHCAVREGIGKATDGLLVDSYWILPCIETGLIEKSQMTDTMTNTNHAVDSRSDPSLFVTFMYTAFPRPKTTTPNAKKVRNISIILQQHYLFSDNQGGGVVLTQPRLSRLEERNKSIRILIKIV